MDLILALALTPGPSPEGRGERPKQSGGRG